MSHQSCPNYPCAVALSFIGAVICAGKSNSTTGTIGAARVWLLLWVFLSLALNQKLQNCFIIIQTISRIKNIMSKTVESYWGLSQIVFGLRCGGGTSGKVPRQSSSRPWGNKLGAWCRPGTGRSLKRKKTARRLNWRFAERLATQKFKRCTWDLKWFEEKRTMKRNLTICKPTTTMKLLCGKAKQRHFGVGKIGDAVVSWKRRTASLYKSLGNYHAQRMKLQLMWTKIAPLWPHSMFWKL